MKTTLRLPEEMREQVDRARGDVPLNTWLTRAVQRALNETGLWEIKNEGSTRTYSSPVSPSVPSDLAAKIPGVFSADDLPFSKKAQARGKR